MKFHYLQRMKRVRAILAGRGLDALLITCPENRRYLSGFTAEDVGISESAGALLILRREAILLTDGRYEVQARDEAPQPLSQNQVSIRCIQETPAALTNRLSAVHSSLCNVLANAR